MRKRDEQLKLRLFDRGGLRQYWLVDPRAPAISAFRRNSNGALADAALWSSDAGDILETPLLSGFRIPLTELFR